MKVVVNRAVGRSFCLSSKAIERLSERKSRTRGMYVASGPVRKFGEGLTSEWIRGIERNDSDLVEVVEELGAEAAGSEAELAVIDINEPTSWHISDVVGYEFVVADGKVH